MVDEILISLENKAVLVMAPSEGDHELYPNGVLIEIQAGKSNAAGGCLPFSEYVDVKSVISPAKSKLSVTNESSAIEDGASSSRSFPLSAPNPLSTPVPLLCSSPAGYRLIIQIAIYEITPTPFPSRLTRRADVCSDELDSVGYGGYQVTPIQR